MDGDLQALTLAIHQEWDLYHSTPMLQHQRDHARQRLLHLMCLYEFFSDENNYRFRRWWVQPIFTVEQRINQGFSDNLVELLKDTNPALYFNFLRMTHASFEKLLDLVSPLLDKDHVVREPIPSRVKLQLVLRYLASGDSQKSISYAFRVSPSSVCNFIDDVCEAIYTVLKDRVLRVPTEAEWLEISEEYKELTDFIRCLGGLDGKLIVMEGPPHSGSDWYSYKGTHAMNLTAICDAKYRFRLVEAGKRGRQSDGGIWAESPIKQRLDNGTLNIPPPSMVDSYELPYCFLADEAYGLSLYIQRPFSRRAKLSIKQRVFNCRQSRGRRPIECTFGIFASRWRIFRSSIIAYPSKVQKMTMACICLHNFIINEELAETPEQRRYSVYTSNDRDHVSEGLVDVPAELNPPVVPQMTGAQYRENFASYFMNEGAVVWQWMKAAQKDY